MITTPGKKRGIYVTSKYTDAKVLNGVDKSTWWTKVACRSPFIFNSTKDQKLLQLQKVRLNIAKELSGIKNVKNKSFKIWLAFCNHLSCFICE